MTDPKHQSLRFDLCTIRPNDGTAGQGVDYLMEIGGPGTDADPTDLTVRFAVGWNDETDRLYFAQHRFDGLYDRDAQGSGSDICAEDGIDLLIDADHSGGRILTAFPGLAAGTGCGRAARPPGRPGSRTPAARSRGDPDRRVVERLLQRPGSRIARKQRAGRPVGGSDHRPGHPALRRGRVDGQPPGQRPGQIIGLGIRLCDSDLGTVYDDSRDVAWSTAGFRVWVGPEHLSDWILLPVSDYWTRVESTSWGQIKASFVQ